jgi:hypothetical protein
MASIALLSAKIGERYVNSNGSKRLHACALLTRGMGVTSMKKALLFLLVPVVMILLMHFARARDFYLGDQEQFRTYACLKQEHLTNVLDVHQNIGAVAAMGLLKGYTDAGVCGVVSLTAVLIRIVKSYVDLPIPEGMITAHVVEVMVENGAMLFVIITLPVLERNQKNPT